VHMLLKFPFAPAPRALARERLDKVPPPLQECRFQSWQVAVACWLGLGLLDVAVCSGSLPSSQPLNI
jgi:hypothetical protein